nr:RNA-directed DNA polymerase, eukaryota, reverse transcriptase zinc-binding domain protein [Tanacetum cinerariifolium]
GDIPVEKVDNWSDENRVNDGQEDGVCVGQHVHARVEVSNDTHESTCSGHFKKSKVPRKGGSILELIDDLVNVGQTMGLGYNMTGFVIMRDFKEVRDISERFGSIFNKHGAEAFNSFIVNAGLVEVPLDGWSFTWCHKSAKKMSKLDRFLIFDNLMCSCPSISSTSLDRFLSDHQPIIMQEAHYDYGPISFKFFHYWFELDGFDKKSILKAELANLDGVIDKGEGSDDDGHRRRETWLEANVNDQNSYTKFMNKYKYLKEKIRIWARLHKESLNSRKSILKAELASLDGVIDKGEGSDDDSHRRREVVRLIQEISHLFYVDDAIFMGQWSPCNIDTIIRVLDVLYRASGLRINMNKNNLMCISVDSNKVKNVAAKIGCLVLKTPFNYLGSRVGDLMSRIQSWHDVNEGMHTRLSK